MGFNNKGDYSSMANRSTSKQFVLSVLFSVVAVILNYIISLVLTPFITENIGTEAYGFVSMAKTFANYASVLTVALNSFSARYISLEYHKGNIRKANVYFNTVFIADIILGGIILIVAIVLIVYLDAFLKIPAGLIVDVKKLFLLDTINFLILSCSTVFVTAITIKNRLELGSIAKSVSYIAEAIFLFIGFSLLKPHIYYVGIGLIISSVIILGVNIRTTRMLTPELVIQRDLFSLDAVKEILSAGIWNSINSIGNMLNTGLDLLVCNVMLSALATGQLAIIQTIATVFSIMYQLVSTAFQPVQLKYYAAGDKKELISSFKIAIKLNGMLSNIAFAEVCAFGFLYYKLWTPSQDISLLHSVTIVSVIGSIIEGAVYPLYYGYTLTIKNRIPCFITIISGLLNILGMYVLIKYINAGIHAVVLTTTVLTWLVNFVFNPMYVSHCLEVRLATFYPTLIRHIISSIALLFLFKLIGTIYYPNSWFDLVIVAVCCTLIGSVVHMVITLNRSEWKTLLKKVIKQSL